MYLRESRRTNRDGSVVAYLQLAHNQRHPQTGTSTAKVIHNFGRADQIDRDAMIRIAVLSLEVSARWRRAPGAKRRAEPPRRYYLSVQEKQSPEGSGPETEQVDTDHADRVRRQWARERPELGTGPIRIIARLGRAQPYIDPALASVFAEHGLTRSSCDVLAALRRGGRPYQLTPTELY